MNDRARNKSQDVFPTAGTRSIVIGTHISMMPLQMIGLKCGIKGECEEQSGPQQSHWIAKPVRQFVRDRYTCQSVEVARPEDCTHERQRLARIFRDPAAQDPEIQAGLPR